MACYADNDPAALEAMSKNISHLLHMRMFSSSSLLILQSQLCEAVQLPCKHDAIFMHFCKFSLLTFTDMAENAIEVAHSAANRWTGISLTYDYSVLLLMNLLLLSNLVSF